MRLTPLAALAAIATLTGCASPDPLVDRRGVSDAQYNRDLAACKQSSGLSLPLSHPVNDCLKSKGYKVLM